jgi:DNA-binding NtrC family response regulator
VLGDGAVRAWALAALGDTLWWQGRYEEALTTASDAAALVAALPPYRVPSMVPERGTLAVLAAVAASRACLALGEPAHAAEHVQAALAHATASGLTFARALSHLARAERCAAVLETDGLHASIARGLLDARQARCRLLALELRITLVEGLHAAGRVPEARAAAGRLARFVRRPLPALLRLRAQLAVADAQQDPAAAALRQAAQRHGLTPLVRPPASLLLRPVMLNDLIEVMRICQEHDDSLAALVRVAELLRERTQAAAVGWVIGSAHGTVVNVPAGRARFTAGQRAIDCGLPIAPHAVNDGTEAAVAVKAGGLSIGALQCRWTGVLPMDGGRLMALLSAVAAAAAGCVRVLHEPAVTPAAPQIEAELLGVSAAMQQVRQAVARAADAPFSVVISGESGSGKELVARAIHRAGLRRSRPFCALNCAALPDDLVEAELFGHARGAFTGALTERRGLFEEADGGVLFLDELGELTARGQAKLLRALQEGEIRRLGETVSRRVDVRIVAATNRALDQEVEAGRFRRDLWYRLDVIRIAVPPLRERPEDVPALAQAFWRRAAERVGSRAVLADRTIAALARYDWPGNVRELQNVLAALAVSGPRRGSIGPALLPATLAGSAAGHRAVTLDEARRVFEMRFVRAALARAGGHRGRAAAELGLTRQGLAKLMGRLGVEPPVAGEAPFE